MVGVQSHRQNQPAATAYRSKIINEAIALWPSAIKPFPRDPETPCDDGEEAEEEREAEEDVFQAQLHAVILSTDGTDWHGLFEPSGRERVQHKPSSAVAGRDVAPTKSGGGEARTESDEQVQFTRFRPTQSQNLLTAVRRAPFQYHLCVVASIQCPMNRCDPNSLLKKTNSFDLNVS
jgi:hypothetical protein